MSVNANGIPVIRFTMTGLFVLPADQASPVVDLSNFKEPEVATARNTPAFSIGSVPFVLRPMNSIWAMTSSPGC